MEKNIKRSIHIEFYGLPGCGKTTVSHRLAVDLTKVGYPVIEPNYDVVNKHSSLMRKLLKFTNTYRQKLFNRPVYESIESLVAKNGYSGNEAFKQIVNVVQKIKWYNKAKECIVVWDQGIKQAAVSLSANSSVNSKDNEVSIKEMLNLSPIVIPVYLKCSISTSENRMAQRVAHRSRVEKIDSIIQRQAVLNKFYDDCEALYSPGSIVIECDNKGLNDIHTELFLQLEERLQNM